MEKSPSKVVEGNFGEAKKTTYTYAREDGSPWFEIIRYDNPNGKKSCKVRYQENGEWIWKKPPNCEGALYGVTKLRRLKGKVPVVICEGEKNALFLHETLGDEFIGVTNPFGAKKWSAEHAKQLEGCSVIIAEDCDTPGRERTRLVAKSLPGSCKLLGVLDFTTDEVGEGGDFQDFTEKNGTEALRDRLNKGLTQIAFGDDVASRDEFYALFEQLFGEIRRDIFTDSLLFFDPVLNSWQPLLNEVNRIKSECLELSRGAVKQWPIGAVEPHMAAYRGTLRPRLIPDIPEWDERDRLAEMAARLQLDPECGISNDHAEALLKEWMANFWRKLREPSMVTSPSREFILILQGPQHCGKDYWLRSLFSALGQWFTDMNICTNERDNLMQLHENAVLNIDEFDRTSRMESSMLKSIITKWSTKLRAAYAKESAYRESRCSLVASVNPRDILRDSTGNSRYCMFPITWVERDYTCSIEFSAQCLAQGRELANERYKADEAAWKAMREFIDDGTPDDPAKELAEWWLDNVTGWLEEKKNSDLANWVKWSGILEQGWIDKADAEELLQHCSKVFGFPRRQVLSKLYGGGLRYRVPGSGNRVIRVRPAGIGPLYDQKDDPLPF